MNSWLVTVTCYVISTGQIVWQRQYFVSDPIILNLAGERVKTQALASSLAHLDVQGTGIPNHAAWGVAGEGYLVYDSKDRNEVSSYSSLVAGAARLKGLTARGKRMLDRRDPLWNRLKVWVDADGTADARKAKLYTMDQLGIASIDIGGPEIVRVDNGNTITKEGIFTYTDGRKGCYAAANLPFEAAVKSSNEKTR